MYFSGFCLQNEQEIFDEYMIKNDFTVCGFSLGAINAFEYTIKQIQNNKRIDKLQLFSPAFFLNKNDKYKRLQLMYFKKDAKQYKDNFLKNIAYPSMISFDTYLSNGTYEQLEFLLNYKWNESDFEFLIKNNVKIEVYLGSDDKIINSLLVKDYFRNFCEVYFIKNVGHILC